MADALPESVLSLIRAALAEDVGDGDVTSEFFVPRDAMSVARIVAREPGIAAGGHVAAQVFLEVDARLTVKTEKEDGAPFAQGEVLLTVAGPTESILTGERVALNFAGHLSGVATATAALVAAVKGTGARIVCTRKTLPNLRILQKYAVRCGGGFNHRFGLDDAVLIKDNHIAAAGGIAPVLERVRAGLGHMAKIEIEVDTLAQLEEALSLGADTILLDNMTPDDLRRAVLLTKRRAVLEASGNVTLQTVRAIAETGVDYISSGAITHSVVNLDIGLDF